MHVHRDPRACSATGSAPPAVRNGRYPAPRRSARRPRAGTSASGSPTTAATARSAIRPAARCRRCRADWRRHAAGRSNCAGASTASASPSITRNSPGKCSPSSASAGMQRRSRSTATTSAPACNNARVSPPGPGPTSYTGCPARSPGTAAIRASNWPSNRKFWPSAFDAFSPCRAMTSRNGGRSRSHRRTARVPLRQPSRSPRSSRPARRHSGRRWRTRSRGRATCGRSAAPA